MGAGTALRNATRTAIGLVGNSVTVSGQTLSYERGYATKTSASHAIITAATTANVVPKIIRERIGDIDSGDLRLYVQDTDTITRTDVITYNSSAYDILDLKPIYVGDTLVVTVATCVLQMSQQ